jgi:hypothetical protein
MDTDVSKRPYRATTAEKFVIRLPEGLRSPIESAARDSHRSMNSEIVARLARSLAAKDTVPMEQSVVAALHPREQQIIGLFRQLEVTHRQALLVLLEAGIEAQEGG